MPDPLDSRQLKADIQTAYDDIADVYLTWTQPSHQTRLSHLSTMLHLLDSPSHNPNPTTHILELGCGAGVPVTQALASRANTNVTANDISNAQLALARARLPASVELIQGDMMALSFPPGRFDAVVAMYSLIHLPRGEQSEMLGRIFAWLRPGGRVLANFTVEAVAGVEQRGWLGGTRGAMHWSGWGREEVRGILRGMGFEVEVDEVVVDEEEGRDGGVRKVEFHWVVARK